MNPDRGVEYVLVMSGQVKLVVDDVPHLLETGDTARFSGLSSHYCTTRDSSAIRSGIDFDSTPHGYGPVGPHSAAACGSLVATAPPGSPVPVGRFCAVPAAASLPCIAAR
ncbi:cupin domain-containing protein [Streptomyces sp. NPDC005181]|uniref:cupin domain-containing protein n=1 Tax=Streptomyces sp. NPDC005181 TaxID=3156869 RepID=UPI0033B11C65